MPRFFCATALTPGATLSLPPNAARHVQVLRLQPGATLNLFNDGPGCVAPSPGEFAATVLSMGRCDVQVRVEQHLEVQREARLAVHLALVMPTNERMDWLVEKAVELGVASLQPLMSERSVLRLAGERAEKKVAHWQSVAVSACEQCGGNRVPLVHPVQSLATWLKARPAPLAGTSLLLSLAAGSQRLHALTLVPGPITFLSGPEGGLSPIEETMARTAGFAPVSLGPRVLRAETAAVTALAALTV